MSRSCKGETGMSGVMLEGFLLKRVIELEKTSEINLGDVFRIHAFLIFTLQSLGEFYSNSDTYVFNLG